MSRQRYNRPHEIGTELVAASILVAGEKLLNVHPFDRSKILIVKLAELNSDRTARKGSSALFNNSGLACIALQYIKAYGGDCDSVGGKNAKKPPDAEIAETFAPNCGVEVSSLSLHWTSTRMPVKVYPA
ncbi:hypothetical protein DCAR_0100642 [Daucus carota subsp. sativus]|uniref:Uncharacterized protein n=1 Tax=Daucus carota subsp. sativus TaxID=79200 RepID=A0A166FTM9_DAUCS|nr:PREDICTED: uncharacterized protein LOC108216412 [Daucus carota subsp. sativus]WOG81493.1 hypothetical protein DCAR_0100642 [Daucus carota subsp. sativus]